MIKKAEQVVAEAFTNVREPEYRISEEEDYLDARIAVAALRDAGMLRSVEHDRQVAEKAWEEGHCVGEENAGIGMASLLTGLPAPKAKQNPYRKEGK